MTQMFLTSYHHYVPHQGSGFLFVCLYFLLKLTGLFADCRTPLTQRLLKESDPPSLHRAPLLLGTLRKHDADGKENVS